MVILLDLLLSIGRDSDKLVGLLGGAVVGLAEGLNQELKAGAHERIKEAKARILEIFIVHLPVILGGDVAVAEVVAGAVRRLSLDRLGFGASNRDDKVVTGKVEVTKVELAERAEEFTQGFGENLEPAGVDGGVVKPVDTLLAILRGVDGGVGIEVVKLEEDFLGTAGGSEPVAGESNLRRGCVRLGRHSGYFAPLRNNTTTMVRKRMRRSRPTDQFWI